MYLYKVHVSQTHQDYVCGVCDKVFSGKLILRRHMLQHDSQFVCNHCHKAFEDEESHNKHKKEHLKRNKEKTIICEICGLTTAYQNVMRRHMLTQWETSLYETFEYKLFYHYLTVTSVTHAPFVTYAVNRSRQSTLCSITSPRSMLPNNSFVSFAQQVLPKSLYWTNMSKWSTIVIRLCFMHVHIARNLWASTKW